MPKNYFKSMINKPGVYPLSEGCYTIGWDKIFKPFNPEIDSMTDRPASLLVEIQPFLLITEKENILLDTGLGFYADNGELIIHQLLLKHHIQPEQINKVLLSHLHKDHLGGSVIKDKLDTTKMKTAFPNATYYVQQGEWNYAIQHSGNSYDADALEVLKWSNQLELLDGSGTIDGFIHYKISGGHTPFHQVYTIETNGEKYFFGGDVAPQLGQMQRKFVAKYDFDGKQSAQLRLDYTKEGIENDYTFLFFHDLKNPVAKLKMENGMVAVK